jgi:hypothetical protein
MLSGNIVKTMNFINRTLLIVNVPILFHELVLFNSACFYLLKKITAISFSCLLLFFAFKGSLLIFEVLLF